MAYLKPYLVKIGGQPEFLLMAADESEFAKTLREILNGRESMKSLGKETEIAYTRPDKTTGQISVGLAGRSQS
jgi:hypothetical protein